MAIPFPGVVTTIKVATVLWRIRGNIEQLEHLIVSGISSYFWSRHRSFVFIVDWLEDVVVSRCYRPRVGV